MIPPLVTVVNIGGVEWTDIVLALSAALGTLAALGGATIAYRFGSGQLQAMNDQVEALKEQVRLGQKASELAVREANETRRAAVQPVVAFEKAAILPGTATSRFLEVQFKNVGLGPAVDFQVAAWIAPAPQQIVDNFGREIDPFVQAAEANVAAAPPKYRAQVHTLAAGETAPLYLADENRSVLLEIDETPAAVVFVTTKFKNIHGEESDYPEPSAPGRLRYIWRFARVEDRLPEIR